MIHKVKHIREQVGKYIPLLEQKCYTPIGALHAEACVTAEPVPYRERMQGDFREYRVGEHWGDLFSCAWFHITGQVPAAAAGKPVCLLIDISGEGCVFDETGCPVKGVTNVSSTYDYSLGMPGKRVVPVSDCAKGGEKIDLWMDAGCNDLLGDYHGDGKIITMDIAVRNDNLRTLYYDLQVLSDLADSVEPETPWQYALLYGMERAVNCLEDFTEEEAKQALVITKELLSKQCGDTGLTFYAVGHGHIDLAWLWPIRETRRKGARTFATQLMLMEKNPNHIFGASQAQLYTWVKQDYPLLYAKIKEKIKSGQWEVQGGMWVESDTNIPCGESLTRQFLYGKRFFRKEFGKDVDNLWLPDVFGYSAVMPQIIKKSGCDYFSTIKLSWSKINKFPYHTFMWKGIDGTAVLTHMPPEGTYNSAALPSSMKKAAKQYQEKGLCDKALIVYGIGDGGGGPGLEHAERLDRQQHLAGSCPVKRTTADDFFHALDKDSARYPVYKGELYVEVHQGTLTTQAKNKKMNRVMEQLLHASELACTQAFLKAGTPYPRTELTEIWQEVLLYQFHDILPGSSIKRVYDESLACYSILEQKTRKILHNALASMAQDDAPALFNPLGWQYDTSVTVDGEEKRLSLKPFGVTPLCQAKPIECHMNRDHNTFENPFIILQLADNGTIARFYDKRTGREMLKPESGASVLSVYTDNGDAWDFPINYRDKPSHRFELKNQEVNVTSEKAVIVQTYHYGQSDLQQTITLLADSPMVTFDCQVNWRESGKMLRADFPLGIKSDKVSCDIQFGHIERTMLENTSLDYAKIEVAAHKWADVSDNICGLALLNDCKYGHYAKNGMLSLGLLRSPNYPGIDADKGEHTFSYALYPHEGNLHQSDVQKVAYQFNQKPVVCSGSGELPVPVLTFNDNIIIETVKLCEDDNAVIVRLYENKGDCTEADITILNTFSKCSLTNLIEDELQPILVKNGHVKLLFMPFEVHTLKLM